MIESKLIQTFKTFSKEELKQFKKFIKSPYFNNGRNYIPFFNELLKYYPAFNDIDFTYQNIYAKLNPGKEFNKQVMWNQVSQLEKLAVEFLLQTGLKNSKIKRFELLFDEFTKRDMSRHIQKEFESIEKSITSLKSGKEFFYASWILKNNQADYLSHAEGRQDKSLEIIAKGTEFLILNFFVDLSVQVWDLLIFKKMYNSDNYTNSVIELVKSLDLKNLVKTAARSNNKYTPLINFYYHKIMCVLDEDNENHFFEIKIFLDENYEMLDPMEKNNTIISLANYCANQMRLGNQKFLKTLFDINTFRLTNEIGVYVNGRITKALYHQMLRNALSLGEIEWAENFVKKYTPKLLTAQQKTMNALAYGLISFAKKDFAASLDFVNKLEFIDIRDKIHVRILSAMAYYELNNSEFLFYFIDSSKHFIRNNANLDDETKRSHLNFFNYLNKILILKEESDKTKTGILKKEIDSNLSLRGVHKYWLLEKIDQLCH